MTCLVVFSLTLIRIVQWKSIWTETILIEPLFISLTVRTSVNSTEHNGTNVKIKIICYYVQYYVSANYYRILQSRSIEKSKDKGR